MNEFNNLPKSLFKKKISHDGFNRLSLSIQISNRHWLNEYQIRLIATIDSIGPNIALNRKSVLE